MINHTQISGIICEFNPLHKGHRLLLQTMRKEGFVVCAMSGNFVQRGEPAILDKWTRTRMALDSGADLVLELPLSFATAGAERFAQGGVGVLNALGCVDTLYFGSECGEISPLQSIATLLKSEAFSAILTQGTGQNRSFAAARETAVAKLMGSAYQGELRCANNILGIEYLKALAAYASDIVPRTIPRVGAGHDTNELGEFMSAGEIRRQLHAGILPKEALPLGSVSLLQSALAKGHCPGRYDLLERAVLVKLRAMTPGDFAVLPDISEGLEHRLYHAAQGACSLEELYALVKSKRYSHARIRRLVLHAFLGVQAHPLSYLRILGMNRQGEEILKGTTPTLPLVGAASRIRKLGPVAAASFALEAYADDIYALALPSPRPCGLGYTERLIRT